MQGLVKQLEVAIIPVVREFYANAKFQQGYQVFIRKKKVSFDSDAINAYYEIPTMVNN